MPNIILSVAILIFVNLGEYIFAFVGSYKNIITVLIKIAIGFGSFALIYWRLKNDFTPDTLTFLKASFSASTAYGLLGLCLVLIPVNWGIESYKWQQITKPVEKISFVTSMKSVYSAICVGNLAPARATEFLAKILFFQKENRPTIGLLHFANGMFQLCITLLFGLTAFVYKLKSSQFINTTHIWLIASFCIFLLLFCILFVVKFEKVQTWLVKKLRKKFEGEVLPYRFNKRIILKLFFLSLLRYIVFVSQFVLIIRLFYADSFSISLMASISIYFLLTTALPMFSLIEAAVRAAIALLVFTGLNIPETTLVIAAVLLWIVNIVIPSIIGYGIIVKEKFDFSVFRK